MYFECNWLKVIEHTKDLIMPTIKTVTLITVA